MECQIIPTLQLQIVPWNDTNDRSYLGMTDRTLESQIIPWNNRPYPRITDHTPKRQITPPQITFVASRMKRRLQEEMKRLKEDTEIKQQAIVEFLEQPTNQVELDGMLAEQLATNSGNIWGDYKVSRRKTRTSGPANSAT